MPTRVAEDEELVTMPNNDVADDGCGGRGSDDGVGGVPMGAAAVTDDEAGDGGGGSDVEAGGSSGNDMGHGYATR